MASITNTKNYFWWIILIIITVTKKKCFICLTNPFYSFISTRYIFFDKYNTHFFFFMELKVT